MGDSRDIGITLIVMFFVLMIVMWIYNILYPEIGIDSELSRSFNYLTLKEEKVSTDTRIEGDVTNSIIINNSGDNVNITVNERDTDKLSYMIALYDNMTELEKEEIKRVALDLVTKGEAILSTVDITENMYDYLDCVGYNVEWDFHLTVITK